MKANRHILLLLLVVASLACARTLVAGEDGGTQSPIFELGTGGREIALGGTGVSFAGGPEALYWNPARLIHLQHAEVSLLRSSLYTDGIGYHTIFFGYPTLDFGSLAFGYQRIGADGLEARNAQNAPLGEFGNSQSDLLLGYGKSFNAGVSWGATLRIAQQSVQNTSDTSFGLDLGGGYDKPLGTRGLHGVSAGVNVQNAVQPRIRLLTEDVPDPRSLKLGLAYTGRTQDGTWSWLGSTEADFPTQADVRLGLGAEVTYASILSLRTGFDAGNPNFGLGIEYRNFRVDYVLRTKQDLSNNNLFAFSMRFGPSLFARRDARVQAQQNQVAEALAQRLAEQEQLELENARRTGDEAFQRRDLEEAQRAYRRVMTLNPQDQLAERRLDVIELLERLGQASSLIEGGQAAQAAAAYQSILDRWPEDPQALAGLDKARSMLQQTEDRERTLNQLFKQALALFTDGDVISAEGTLDELLRMEPGHELGQELLDRVRTKRYADGQDRLQRARNAADRQRFSDALTHLKESRRLLGPSSELDALRIKWISARDDALLARQRNRNRTISEDATPKPPSRTRLSADRRRELARLYQEGLSAFTSSDFNRAIRNWREVWLADPEYESVSDNLIKAYLLEVVELYGRGEYDAALSRCRDVLEIDSKNAKAKRYENRIREEKSELEQIGKDSP